MALIVEAGELIKIRHNFHYNAIRLQFKNFKQKKFTCFLSHFTSYVGEL